MRKGNESRPSRSKRAGSFRTPQHTFVEKAVNPIGQKSALPLGPKALVLYVKLKNLQYVNAKVSTSYTDFRGF